MFRWTWAAWAGAGLALEAAALRRKQQAKDTLSENLRAVLLVNHPVARRVTLAAWFLFAAWFTEHIWG